MASDGADRERCPECGGETGKDRSDCPACRGAPGPRLRVADGPGGASEPVPPAVRLVREFKGPTVEQILRSEDMLARLPSRLRRVVDAVARGQVPEAEARLDAALGQLLAGPGSGRRGFWRRIPVLRVLLWLLLLGLLWAVLVLGV